MKVVAEAIGDLHYESLYELFKHLVNKFEADAIKDGIGEKKDLSWELFNARDKCCDLTVPIFRIWQISKPFMEGKE